MDATMILVLAALVISITAGLLLLVFFGILSVIFDRDIDFKEYLPLDGEEIEHTTTSRNR